MTYDDIITNTQPKLLDIADAGILNEVLDSTNFLIYGEIHGIKENADVIYTLVHKLGIERLAIENSPTIKPFIDAAAGGVYDFSLIDTDVFDSSILSVEMAKSIAVLLHEGTLQDVVYIDTYFDTPNIDSDDDTDSPQFREQTLASNILNLDQSQRTLCIMGQWHTQSTPVKMSQRNTTISEHLSTLYRIRQVMPGVPFVHNIYRSGTLFNDGREIKLPDNLQISNHYQVVKVSDTDFELQTPFASHISIPSAIS